MGSESITLVGHPPVLLSTQDNSADVEISVAVTYHSTESDPESVVKVISS